jgi:hypothetical protein
MAGNEMVVARRVIVGTPHIRVGEAPEPGGWLTATRQDSDPALRDRVGRQAVNAMFGSAGQTTLYNHYRDRLLTPEQLWLVYERCPDVRAAIDAIVRRVATWDWMVEPTMPATDGEQHTLALAESAQATAFLSAPNNDGETWQEVWTKVVTDIMVFDAGSIEQVYDSKIVAGEVAVGDNLQELVALRGANIHPVVDPHGKLLGYVQDTYTTTGTMTLFAPAEPTDQRQPRFAPRQITYMRLFPNTSSPEGVPLIESIVNEIVTMLRSSEHTMLSLDADEIPPGILVLTGIAGKAAQDAKADLQKMRGKDHKIRVVTNADPQAVGAKWVELRRTPKDVDFVNVVAEVRRTIWRVFGVLPVEMGQSENMPRAVGQVQLEVSSSHLIGPILELIESKVNARILPLVVGKDGARRVRFRFDRDSKLTPAELQAKAQMLATLVDRAILTRNEARVYLGHAPMEGGNVATLTTGQGVIPLIAALGTAGDTKPQGEGSAQPAQPAAQPAQPEPNDPASATRFGAHVRSNLNELPSEWQPAGRFRGLRTLPLTKLHDAVIGYQSAVEPHYNAARDAVVAAFRANWSKDGLHEDNAPAVRSAIARAIDKLANEWELATLPSYATAARIARDTARDFTGAQVLEDWNVRAASYQTKAMHYLTRDGVLADVKKQLLDVVNASASHSSHRSTAGSGIAAEITSASTATEVLNAAMAIFEANAFRVQNWSGKLVELATYAMMEGAIEAGTVARGASVEAPVAGVEPVEWWAQWVAVGDNSMCPTCRAEAAKGFRPASSFTTVPGGATECMSRCRCVVVMWTRTEVEKGTAVRL